MKPSTILSFLALALPFAGATSFNKHHQEIAVRARGDVQARQGAFTGARLTFYDVGLGACGAWSRPTDLIVALNVEQFGPGYPGEHCWKPITIRCDGVFVEATIVDKCEGCPWAGLDLSRGLFTHFAPESVGVLDCDWWFNGD